MSDKKTASGFGANHNAIIIGLSVVLVVFVLLFINEKSKKGGGSGDSTEIVKPLADEQVILTYKGGEIKAKEVKGNVAGKAKELSEQLIDMYKKGAENALVEKLLNEEAKKKGVANIPALLESLGTTSNPTDAEVDAFIKENNLQNGYKDPQTGKVRKVGKDEIRGYLGNQSKTKVRQDYISKLVADANVEWKLKESRTQIPPLTSDEPVLGNPNAKVVVYEYSDFQCPYCSRAKGVVHEISKAYGDKVAIVFRHLPLDFHPEAKPSAIAATCAQQQGKFWEFHDKLFDNQKQLSDVNRLKWAKEIGLDEAKFKTCLSGPEAQKTLEKSMAFSEPVGANSTPTFFVGSKTEGRKVAGAQPFAEFKKLIDEALKL